MKTICLMLFSLFTVFSYSAEYEVSLLGLETTSDESWIVSDFNDEGQILGTFYQNGKSTVFVFDIQKGINFIENEDNLYPKQLNNAGEVLGIAYLKTGVQKPFIWNKASGIRYLELDSKFTYSLIDMNDLGQVLMTRQYWDNQGYQSSRPFIWYYGVVTDMGLDSEFAKKIEALGYYIIDIQLTSINNKGELVGSFSFGKFNEKKNKYVVVGRNYFFWNGDIHVLPFTNDRFSYLDGNIKLNNLGTVVVPFGTYNMGNQKKFTYVWNAKNGLKVIQNFNGISLNDSNIVIGSVRDSKYKELGRHGQVPALWREGSIKVLHELLGVDSLMTMSPEFSENYDVEQIEIIYLINNKGEIPCSATIWGDQYQAILKAVNTP